jgi:hypothetical protein
VFGIYGVGVWPLDATGHKIVTAAMAAKTKLTLQIDFVGDIPDFIIDWLPPAALSCSIGS